MSIEVNVIELFERVDEYCRQEAQNIFGHIKHSPATFSSNIFRLQDDVTNLDSIKNEEKQPGIYVFMVSSDFKVDLSQFNDVPYAAQTNENLLGDGCFKKGNCFYLGKSESGVFERVSEHINNQTKKTYSLRLNDIARMNIVNYLKLSSFTLKPDFIRYKKLLLPEIEGYLHDLMLPKVGSKRT